MRPPRRTKRFSVREVMLKFEAKFGFGFCDFWIDFCQRKMSSKYTPNFSP